MKDYLREGGAVTFANNQGDGTGVAEFETKQDMEDAIDRLDDKKVRGIVQPLCFELFSITLSFLSLFSVLALVSFLCARLLPAYWIAILLSSHSIAVAWRVPSHQTRGKRRWRWRRWRRRARQVRSAPQRAGHPTAAPYLSLHRSESPRKRSRSPAPRGRSRSRSKDRKD